MAKPLAVSAAPVKPEAHLPGRTYPNAAQLRQAYQTGDLDRPIKSLLAVDSPLEHGAYRWDDAGIAKGPTWIRVDLNSQILSVFRGGHEIGTAVILYGAQSKQTPPGVYPILAKAKRHRSSLYDADMPFTLRLTDDGISIHGSNVRWGAATHGCIGVPVVFAEKLFDAVATNDDVVVLRRLTPRAADAQS
ncbi:MAG: L,D-transpeptidase family protein [Sphingomonas bacterium]|nr:L,D-transpeptidase family protein [Sphingomonas bacterium]